MPSNPRIALIIPAFNEAALLPRLLDSVDRAHQQYALGSEAIEVIVADNASTDETSNIARRRGCVVANISLRLIGAARSGGADSSRADMLAFVDADSQIHPETFNAIDCALSRIDIVGGATGLVPERWSAGIAATWMLLQPLTWLMGLDGGVVFCRRADWAAVGGYPQYRLVSEDVGFLLALKRLGRRRGQCFVRTPGVRTIMSTRKFDAHGDWHFFRQMFVEIPLSARHGRRGVDGVLRRYWYEDRK